MSFSRLWLFLAVALPVLASLIAPMSTVDLGYHLRAGAGILDTGAIPTVDTWTYTIAGQPWFDQQWGAQVILAYVEGLGGWTALAIFRAAIVGGIIAGLLVIARRRALAPRPASLLVLAAFIVMSPALALRPQLLGMGCFVLLLLVLTDRRDHPMRLWLAVPVVIAWANLHGSFFLGPMTLGLAWFEDVHDRVPGTRGTLLVALASVIAASVTPFGPLVWTYAAGLSANPEVTRRVTEWQPTSLRDVPGILFFASVAGVATLIARHARALAWPTLAWLGVFIALGIYTQRGLAWWPLAAIPAVAGTLLRRSTGPVKLDAPALRRINIAIVGGLSLTILAFLPMWRPADPGSMAPAGLLADAPPGVTAALREVVGPGDHLFVPQVWGSWIEFALPDAKVAVDSRIELFAPATWDDYEAVLEGRPGWEEQLQRWEVSIVVIESDAVLTKERLIQSGWTSAYGDSDGFVLTKPDT